jgi:hypothetical protein
MKVNVKITEDVIKRSSWCNYKHGIKIEESSLSLVGQNCAIGKAIFDLFGSISWVYKDVIGIFPEGIDFDDLGMMKNNSKFQIILPDEAADFIVEFDNRTPEARLLLKPFEFIIDVPTDVIELIGIGEVYKVLSESKTLEHVNV